MIQVEKRPVDPGPSGWGRILPDGPTPMPLDGEITADWLVIGAGFAGLAAARRLSQLCDGDSIVVLDATRIGDGPAGRNSGFMIDLPHDLASDDYRGNLDSDRDQIADNRKAIGFAQEMARDFGLSDEAFALSGKINGAATERGERHNATFAQHLGTLGEAYERLDAAQMRAVTGIGYYRGGVFMPGTAMIQPALYVRGAVAGLRSNRVAIHDESPVIGLERRGDWIAETLGGQVTAPRVILAVNGHLNSFGFLRGRLMHVFTYASMTRALTQEEAAALGGHPRWGITPADPMGTTVRRIADTGGDRIVIRNRFTFDPSMEVSDARIARVARDHDRAFAARFPMLSGVGMEYRWGGRLCLSRNGVQMIGEIEDGLYAACCQNGLGAAKGTLAGMLAAELAAGHGSAALDRALAAAPPRALPPDPIASLGAAVRLRWGEARAGREL